MNVTAGIAEDFTQMLRAGTAEKRYREVFLPELLTLICVDVLTADGASLSLLSGELRMPLAASGEHARVAELVQFTLGDGPCMDTYRTTRAKSWDEAELTRQWPLFLDALVAKTPYRSVTSVPLDLGGTLVGGLDVYFVSPVAMSSAALADARAIGRLVAQTLREASGLEREGPDARSWMQNPSTRGRATTWIAVGIVAQQAGLASAEALDVIRAYSVQLGQSVDVVSYEIATNTQMTQQLLAEVRPA